MMKHGQLSARYRKLDIWETNIQYFRLQKKSPPLEEQKKFVKGSLITLERDIQKAINHWKGFPLKTATFEEIKAKTVEKDALAHFIDTEFLPQDSSI